MNLSVIIPTFVYYWVFKDVKLIMGVWAGWSPKSWSELGQPKTLSKKRARLWTRTLVQVYVKPYYLVKPFRSLSWRSLAYGWNCLLTIQASATRSLSRACRRYVSGKSIVFYTVRFLDFFVYLWNQTDKIGLLSLSMHVCLLICIGICVCFSRMNNHKFSLNGSLWIYW